jgi:hypothetical protein
MREAYLEALKQPRLSRIFFPNSVIRILTDRENHFMPSQIGFNLNSRRLVSTVIVRDNRLCDMNLRQHSVIPVFLDGPCRASRDIPCRRPHVSRAFSLAVRPACLAWPAHGHAAEIDAHNDRARPTDFDGGTRTPLVGRKTGMTTDTIAETLDLRPNVAQPAGLPIPSQGDLSLRVI